MWLMERRRSSCDRPSVGGFGIVAPEDDLDRGRPSTCRPTCSRRCNRRDPDHEPVTQAVLADRGPYLVPAGILAEIGYLIEQRLGLDVLDAFHADLPLGLADATVIACAERHGGTLLALDNRHFGTVAREGTITLLPA